MKRLFLLPLCAALINAWTGSVQAGTLQICLVSGSVIINAELDDNSASRDLLNRLPLEVTLEDFGSGQERIFYPEPALSLDDVSYGHKPRAGDIAIFAPWNNVALFLKDAGYHDGLVRLGSFDKAQIRVLEGLNKKTMRIERGQ